MDMSRARKLQVNSKQQLELAANHPGLFALVWLINLGKKSLPISYLREYIFPGSDLNEVVKQLNLGTHLGYFTYGSFEPDGSGDFLFTVKEGFVYSMREKVPQKIKDVYKPYWEDGEFVEAWSNWGVEVRQKKKTAMSPRADNMHLKKLTELSKGNIAVMVKIIDQSANNGYTDLYELKYAVKPEKKTGTAPAFKGFPQQ